MSLLPVATVAPKAKTKDVTRIATFYAILLVIFAVSQLFTYESFLQLMVSFGLPGGTQFTYFLTSLLVVAEVFALPFLLRLPLSRAFRWFSLGCAWLVPVIWMFVTVVVAGYDLPADNIGFLGTVVSIMPGWWAVFISTAFFILAAWASWGMWPGKTRKK
ncbi:MAG: rane protein of unknown function [Candidatus Saccharibacteria bacterium]|nr:rane protein of unknown function [Candidatus Saccharibacteria bacterium]